ncbi:phage tail tape measure protein [Sphingopyxis macrogoltabida]|uniref:Bacteriophage tail tape measure C-terminal domain-containing protein n=1 Tax=Sphingopyxis macrogoltabida TaxID=33050 RepID=A0AAC8Z1L0_SPHMC|nr:hypothetical protein [Sphingopyxis macrogoltabida]ALJ12645.1 hypothetical protein LH19_07175 [Sphingopyxis macrogoltabida]AMU89887.1 hypothetical protein ATM17_12660 [Sphingopyxis macrogoltabida]
MDVAALNLSVESKDVVSATTDLDKFSASADRAAASAGKLSGNGNAAKLAQDYARAARAADQAGGSVAKATQMVAAANAHVVTYRNHLQGIVTASGHAATAQTALAGAVSRTSTATQQSDAHVIAYRNNLERLATANKSAGTASTSAATGVAAVGTASRATSAIVSGLAGILGGLIGVIIGGMLDALLQMVAGLFEADKAMERVELASDGLSDAQGVLGKMFDLTTGKIKSQNEMLILNARLMAANLRGEAARDKEAAASGLQDAVNSPVRGYGGVLQSIFNPRGYDASQFEREKLRDIARRVDIGILGESAAAREAKNIDFSKTGISESDFLTTLAKRYSSAAKVKIADEIEKSIDTGTLSDVFREEASAGRKARERSGRRGGKTDAEKTADLIRNAEAEITVEQNRSRAVEMSAEAAAELEQKTKLLNAAASAGIKVTPELTKKIEDLAATYAGAKVAADMSEVITSNTDDIRKQTDAMEDQRKLVGLYGDDLARATREMEAQKKIRDALPKGAIWVVGKPITGGLSDQIEADAQAKRIADLKKWSEDTAYAMDLERSGLQLTGEAALEYAFISERLNEAQRARVRQSPEEIAAIREAGAAYAKARYAIDQQAKAIADAREVTRGFFSDWAYGVRQGENIFKAFADSVVNGLNRIIDKLMDRAFENMFSGGGGGGFLGKLFGSFSGLFGGSSLQSASLNLIAANPGIFAKGAAFDRAHYFANGAAFSNSILNSPTLFKFANGGKLGVAGEAGPEAVMPLTRGSDGKLGVQAHGGGGGRGGPPPIIMGDINQEIRIDGGFTPESAVAMIKQGGEATIAQIKRELQSLLEQLERDGVLVG